MTSSARAPIWVLSVLSGALLTLLSLPANTAGLNASDLGRLFGIVKNSAEALKPIPEPKEIEIGRGLAATLVGAAPLVENDELQSYVNRVGRWIALQTERAQLPWRFGVLDTETINAFATPGGYVFVTMGLLQVTRSESELAGVLAHEIGHVLHKHHLRAIQKQAATKLAADVAGMVLSSNQALFDQLTKIGMGLYARGLDREDEFESDRTGVVLAARAGYDPYGLPAHLATLESIHGEDSRVTLMTSTHPPMSDRIESLDEQMTGTLDRYAGQNEGQGRFQRQAALQ